MQDKRTNSNFHANQFGSDLGRLKHTLLWSRVYVSYMNEKQEKLYGLVTRLYNLEYMIHITRERYV